MLRINILSIQYILDIPGNKDRSYYGSDRFRVNVVLSMYVLITCTVIFKKNRSPFFELFFFLQNYTLYNMSKHVNLKVPQHILEMVCIQGYCSKLH